VGEEGTVSLVFGLIGVAAYWVQWLAGPRLREGAVDDLRFLSVFMLALGIWCQSMGEAAKRYVTEVKLRNAAKALEMLLAWLRRTDDKAS